MRIKQKPYKSKENGRERILKVILQLQRATTHFFLVPTREYRRTLIGLWSPWLKAPQTGATRTLTWIARIHSHTYVNTVTTAWCEAPAKILV